MEKNKIPNKGIETLSEGWWSAVLAEDECHSGLFEDEQPRKRKSIPESQKGENDWEFVGDLLTNENVITCTVVDYNRGGLLVCNEKFHGFVPVSHLDELPGKESDEAREERLKQYIGCRLRLKVIECDSKRGRIVLSERAAQTKPGQRQKLLETLEVDNVISGKVTNITEFGVFVDLGGVEGLIHISELSWGRVIHPGDCVKLYQELDVLILQVNREKCRVSLSLKQLQPNPWKLVYEQFPSGTVLHGTVTQIVKFGAFTRLEEGVEGLIHISEMGIDHISSPWEVLEEGQEVDVEVVLVDPERQRMSLRLLN
ncbi:MAG: S1 RNA-binding domain-containing protein [Anaerolineales bacterium]|jgi:small subunit ribosomal protein S1